MLTTHVGSLPRSPKLTELLLRQERSEVVDETELAQQVETAVETVVRKQLEVGIASTTNLTSPLPSGRAKACPGSSFSKERRPDFYC
jgi:5-methyltetrahydropteroyltriglutamate--homocysteine methyltransferase